MGRPDSPSPLDVEFTPSPVHGKRILRRARAALTPSSPLLHSRISSNAMPADEADAKLQSFLQWLQVAPPPPPPLPLTLSYSPPAPSHSPGSLNR
jgi:hypothetical protein